MINRLLSIAFLFTFSLSCYGCGSQTYKKLDIGDLGPITGKTFSDMTNCMENKDVKSCKRATELLDENPWLLTGNFDGYWLENRSGLLQDEWEAEVLTIQSKIREIRTIHPHFVVDAYSYINQ
ncbi:MAG: hypothetical protein JRC87_07255 [Deltaproteobacteria bacterium]|nr:hypothetical protein [Deltaproteobacteria bacterium]MBW2659373.1 hypothetical protein [Deltaproteobacteria bacterium]